MLEDFIEEIKISFDDNFLGKIEKRSLKDKLKTLTPSKRQCDFIRSELFNFAQNKINKNNYAAVLTWVEEMNKVILSNNNQSSTFERVYFSPGKECLDAILNQIKLTKQTIKICLFTISDDRITDALIEKHQRGVSIKVLTDNDKLYDKGSDIRKFVKTGIPVKVDITDSHMHHKFALFDKKTTLTGSYNWTRSAERYNHENILITNSSNIFKQFDKEFNNLWKELVFYDEN